MSDWRWKDQPWAEPETLLSMLVDYYKRAYEATGKGVVEITARKVRAERKWHPSVPEADLQRAIQALEVLYVPGGVGPGPGIAFPIRDVTGDVRRMHIRLMGEGPEFYGMRYMSLTNKDAFVGPAWCGVDDDTLTSIIQQKEALIVEGPMDLLAVRVAGSPIPAITSLTKSLKDDHMDYLRILGVKTIHALLDNDKAGGTAAGFLARNPFGISVEALTCPMKDPAKLLQAPSGLRQLRELVNPLSVACDLPDDVF